MKKLTTEEIKRASKIAVKGYHTPKGFSKGTWEHNMGVCNRIGVDYVPNAIRNKVDIQRALRESVKAMKKK